MSTVKINCPKCLSLGLVGTAVVSVCPQCLGQGSISQDDTQTLAALNTSESTRTTNATPIVVTVPMAIPTAVAKVVSKGK